MSRTFAIFRRASFWGTVAVLLLVTPWTLFCLVEKYRGKKRWEAYRKTAIERGVKLDLHEVLPPDVPDSENFAATPMVRRLFATPPGEAWFAALKLEDDDAPRSSNEGGEKPLDLAAWRNFLVKNGAIAEPGDNPARDILQALDADDDVRQLVEGLERRRGNFSVQWEKGFAVQLPHYGPMQAAAKMLRLRAAAQLATGDSASAGKSVRGILRVREVLLSDPSVLSGLVRSVILSTALRAVRDGVALGQWKEPELKEVIASLAAVDVFADWRFALKTERVVLNVAVEDIREKSSLELARGFATLTDREPSPAGWLLGFVYPRGWFYGSQTLINEYFDASLATADDWAAGRPLLERAGGIEAILSRKREGVLSSIPNMLAILVVPVMEEVHPRYLRIAAQLAQTRTACALELHRIEKGGYPEALAGLVPEYLPEVPLDPLDRQPLRYRRVEGRYDLWSVGLDRTDDGGQVETGKWKEQKDWRHGS